MRTKLTLLVLAISCLFVFSCKREYKKTDNGALMKFYEINKENPMPEIGDLVLVDVIQKISDSVLFNTEVIGEPFEVLIEEPSFAGDFMCALLSMHLNDHASLIFSLDSMFLSIGEQLPEYIEAGQQANCYIVGVPSETTTGSVHGYVIKAYTTKHLKLVGAAGVVTSTGQTWADATSATKQITPSDDMPDQVKALSCAYDGEGIGSSIKATSFGCGVFYTVKNSNANAFKP
jgi:hypothetical protein